MGFLDNSLPFFLLFLSLRFLSTPAIAARNHRAELVVDIRNALPSNTKVQLTLRCGEEGSFDLKLGDHYSKSVKVGQVFSCTAQWLPWFTTWDAYEAKRDKGRVNVYWLVKQDGFYLSWDKLNWKKVENWYTE